MKITMMGISGSGKTSYMAALSQELSTAGVDDFLISTDRLGQFAQIGHAEIGFAFHAGTEETTLWSFDLLHRGQTVCEFEWMDYRGGDLEFLFRGQNVNDEEQAKRSTELISHIRMSNGVLIFLDSIILTSDDNIDWCRHHTGANIISRILQDYATQHPYNNLAFTILLTKADSDLISEEWKINNYERLIERGLEAFDPLVRICDRMTNSWKGGILPVGAVGEGNVSSRVTTPKSLKLPAQLETELVLFPEPLNVVHPLFFCLGHTLYLTSMHRLENIQVYEKEYTDALENISLTQDIFARIFKVENPRKRAEEYLAKKTKEEKKLQAISSSIDPLYALAMQKIRRI